MRIVFVLMMTVLLAGCGGIRKPSDRYIYDQACAALQTDATVPPGATPLPMNDARIGVAKNAASVDLPYDYQDGSGQTRRGCLTVWFKRVARTWTVERTTPAPDVSPVPSL